MTPRALARRQNSTAPCADSLPTRHGMGTFSQHISVMRRRDHRRTQTGLPQRQEGGAGASLRGQACSRRSSPGGRQPRENRTPARTLHRQDAIGLGALTPLSTCPTTASCLCEKGHEHGRTTTHSLPSSSGQVVVRASRQAGRTGCLWDDFSCPERQLQASWQPQSPIIRLFCAWGCAGQPHPRGGEEEAPYVWLGRPRPKGSPIYEWITVA